MLISVSGKVKSQIWLIFSVRFYNKGVSDNMCRLSCLRPGFNISCFSSSPKKLQSTRKSFEFTSVRALRSPSIDSMPVIKAEFSTIAAKTETQEQQVFAEGLLWVQYKLYKQHRWHYVTSHRKSFRSVTQKKQKHIAFTVTHNGSNGGHELRTKSKSLD